MRMKLIILLLSSLIAFCVGCAVNPVTGKNEIMLYGSSVENDVAMGRQAAVQIDAEFKKIAEKEGRADLPIRLSNYVNYVGQKIAAVSHNPELDWKFTVVNDDAVNAFALPGGYIYITTGMLKNLKSEDQLASILAHEAVHVTARHSAAQMSRNTAIGIAISVATTDETASAMRVVNTVAQLEGLSYSRKHEMESDLYGLEYLYKAGYSPYAMAETMQILNDLNESRSLEFFSTHPNPKNRKQLILEEISERGYTYFGKPNGDDYYKNVLVYLK